MTTIAATPLTDSLQSLIDARLDTIDRMLLGRVNRHDRLAIVREVESQIFDLLEGREAGSLDRDDVLAVLARLDPPEAYLPDEDSTVARPARVSASPRGIPTSGEPQAGRIGFAAGILGILSLSMTCLGYPVALGLGSESILLAAAVLGLIAGVQAVVFAAVGRLRGAWSLVGLVTGIMSLMTLLGMAIFLLL